MRNDRLSIVIPHIVQMNSDEVLPIYKSPDTNGMFLREHAVRKRLLNLLEQYYMIVPPQVSIEDALSKGYLALGLALELYETLAEYMALDRFYYRLLLYVPFELIPNKDARIDPLLVVPSIQRFLSMLRTAWYSLLENVEVRANYVTGDYEVDSITQLVCKAAHWSVVLVARGYMTQQDLELLMQNSHDEVVKNSLREALAALGALGAHDSYATEPLELHSDSFDSVLQRFILLVQSSQRSGDKDGVSGARFAWLERYQIDCTINGIAQEVGRYTTASSLKLLDRAIRQVCEPTILCGIMRGIRNSITLQNVVSDDDQQQFEVLVRGLQTGIDPLIIDECTVVLNHLMYVQTGGRIARYLYESFDFTSSNVVRELENVTALLIAGISNDPVLCDYVVPVALAIGSRIKGCAREDSDVDLAWVIRPVEQSILKPIASTLNKLHASVGVSNPILFRTMETEDGGWQIVEPDRKRGSYIGSRTMTNYLCTGAWIGTQEDIIFLQDKLSVVFRDVESGQVRHKSLRQLEISTVVYRLMHNGYDRMFPRSGGLFYSPAPTVDSDSVFWDAGYRRMATRLFVATVWTP